MSTSLNVIAYILLCIFITMRLFIKKRSCSAIARSSIMFTLMFICVVDLIWVKADNNRATTPVVNILNVVLILCFVRAIREVWGQFMQVVVASVPVFVIILAYLIIFTIIGFIMFANSQESQDFSTIVDSLYTVFVLFTVSNYPDVQMPFFINVRISFLYFWIFLLIGIFLLSNLLLA